MSAVVEQVVQARLILSTHRSALLRVTLRYRAGDPLAVRMAFPAEYSLDGIDLPQPDPEIEWVFARQLLAAGLDLPAGPGDVHIRPALGGRTMVELRAPEGVALLQFDTPELRRFLWHSYLAVPEGQELQHLDPDRALAELLG
ncbi:SsgA family sporulation/cell division regulator [Kitasatospora atroaurantiaca]|uniref:Sporulation and cell division protein SsgA n=1 Tax=Kitasatospora atroaurantiaca TaxID=285545 RepID=A0A561EPK4_9ACTN|nr:SsgA family sporulation/cell division regulator [Kitasatospora atroaurantiaca]TWE17552.1 sporulation and cell division protein SsgA [Kitasatospora atroaurantiaca]